MQTENRSQRIAVTGATGSGRIAPRRDPRGHDVVPIARSWGVDVVSGEGLDEALVGAETIIDTATGPSPDQAEATAFFTASARNLQRAGAAAGAKRIVVVSIIGIDKFRGGYNAAKLAQEQTLLEGPLPVRIVRAAQPGREARRPQLRRVARGGQGVRPHQDPAANAPRRLAVSVKDRRAGRRPVGVEPRCVQRTRCVGR